MRGSATSLQRLHEAAQAQIRRPSSAGSEPPASLTSWRRPLAKRAQMIREAPLGLETVAQEVAEESKKNQPQLHQLLWWLVSPSARRLSRHGIPKAPS